MASSRPQAILLHAELGVSETVITNLQKKSKRDKDVAALLESLNKIFIESSPLTLKKEISELLSKVELAEINKEQELHALEEKLNDTEGQNKASKEQLEKFETIVKEITSELGDKEIQITHLKETSKQVQEEALLTKEEKDKILREKEDLLYTLGQKIKEIENVQNDQNSVEKNISFYRDELTKVQKSNVDLKENLDIVKSAKEFNEHKIKMFSDQIDSLQSELASKTKAFSQYRTDKSTELTTLNISFESLQSECKLASQKAETFENQVRELTESRSKDQLTILDLRNQISTQETNFSSELTAQIRLVEIYKENCTQFEVHIDELEEELNEKDKSIERFTLSFKEYEKKINNEKDNLIQELQSYKEEAEKLRSIVDGLPEGLSATDDTSVTAGLISNFQKKGKSFTEVYSDYVKVQKEVVEQKREIVRLNRVIAAFAEDIKSKTPLLQKQKSDYERVSLEAEEVSKQLNKVLLEKEKIFSELKEVTLREKQHKRSCALLEEEAESLAKQVRVLTSENQSLRHVSEPSKESPTLITDVASVVENELIPFRSIEELQQKNQALLKITRELAFRMEAEELKLKATINELQNSFSDDAQGVIGDLRTQLEKKDIVIKSFKEEIDLLRRTHEADQRQATDSTLASLQSPQTSSLKEKDLEEELAQNLKHSTQNFVALMADNKALALEKQKKATECAHLEATNKFLEERFAIYTKTCEGHLNEIKEIRDRNKKLEETLANRELAYNKLYSECEEAKNHREMMRHQGNLIYSELENAKAINQRLESSSSQLISEKTQLNDRLIQVQVQLDESQSRIALILAQKSEQIEALDNEKKELRIMLETSQNDNRSLTLRNEKEFREKQDKIDILSETNRSIQEKLLVTEGQAKQLQDRLDSLAESKEKLESILQASSSPDSLNEKLIEMRSKLEEENTELLQARQDVEQYQAMSKASEDALLEETSKYHSFKATTEAQINASNELIGQLRQREKDLQERYDQLTAIHTKCADSESALISKHEEEKEELQSQLNALSAQEEFYIKSKVRFEEELARLKDELEKANSNYERELSNHSDKIKQANDLRDSNESLTNTVTEIENQLERVKSESSMNQESFKKKEEFLQDQIKDLNQRIKDLNSINNTILDQLQKAETKNINVDGDLASNMSEMELGNDPEVIGFLRREKELALAKLEVVNAECRRLKFEKETLIKSLESARQTLDDERRREHDLAQNAISNQELEKTQNQAILLTDSNNLLRSENSRLVTKTTQLESKLYDAQAQLEPLQGKVRTLEAEKDVTDKEIKMLEQDNERWKNRANQILKDTSRIDPAEYQKLKSDLESVTKQYEEATTSLQELQTKFEDAEKKHVESSELYRSKLKDVNERGSKWVQRYRELERKTKETTSQAPAPANDQENITLKAKVDGLEKEIISFNAKVDSLEKEKKELEQKVGLKMEAEIEGEDNNIVTQLVSILSVDNKGLIIAKVSSMLSELDKQKASITDLKNRGMSVYDLLKKSKERLNQKTEEFDSLQTETKAKIDAHLAKISELEGKTTDSSSHQNQVNQFKQEITMLKVKVNELNVKHKQELETKNVEIQTIGEGLENQKNLMVKLEDDYSATVGEMSRDIEMYKLEVYKVKQEVVSHKTESDSLKKEIESRKEEVIKLKQTLRKLIMINDKLKQELNRNRNATSNPLANSSPFVPESTPAQPVEQLALTEPDPLSFKSPIQTQGTFDPTPKQDDTEIVSTQAEPARSPSPSPKEEPQPTQEKTEEHIPKFKRKSPTPEVEEDGMIAKKFREEDYIIVNEEEEAQIPQEGLYPDPQDQLPISPLEPPFDPVDIDPTADIPNDLIPPPANADPLFLPNEEDDIYAMDSPANFPDDDDLNQDP